MKLSNYFSSLSEARRLLLGMAVSNAVLAMAVLVLVLLYSSRDIVTRIVPVGMGTVAEIGARSANADYKRSIALYVATMSSSLQPNTAAGVVDDLSQLFSPEVYREYRDQALQIIKDPVYRQAGVVSVFVPSSVMYEASTDRVFVIGSHILRGAGINRSTSIVYEMSVGIANGRPVITYIKSYAGTVPQTLQSMLSRLKGKVDLLPEYAKPLASRELTPDQQAQEEVQDRGEIDMTPQANHQQLLGAPEPASTSFPAAQPGTTDTH